MQEQIRELALQSNRNITLELQAYNTGEYYYMQSSVGEVHEGDLYGGQDTLIGRTFREFGGCTQEAMNAFRERAAEQIRVWSIEEGRDPEEQIRLWRLSSESRWGYRVWIQERVRALWVDM